MNRDPIREMLGFDDARVGYRTPSMVMAKQINDACRRALERRGLKFKFCRMDFAGANYLKKRSRKEAA